MKPIDSHFAKPGVVPVEILPVFPDFNLWKYPCAQVDFAITTTMFIFNCMAILDWLCHSLSNRSSSIQIQLQWAVLFLPS